MNAEARHHHKPDGDNSVIGHWHAQVHYLKMCSIRHLLLEYQIYCVSISRINYGLDTF